MTEREWATEVVRTLQAAGYRTLWAGGCVRDELLGLTPADYDLATLARPEEVTRLFRRSIGVGASFGVVEVLGPRDAAGGWPRVQVATFRKDGRYTDGRRPDAVAFSSPEEDAQRRDFTINGLFYDPVARQLFDYVGGERDLNARVLRAIGEPRHRFAEDKLRVLRAARMAARFGLSVDPATAEAARAMADQVSVVSAERIAEEMRKILAHPSRARGFAWLRDLGLLRVLFPEETADPAATEAALARLPAEAPFEVGLAHVLAGCPAEAVAKVTQRLKLANRERDLVAWLAKERASLREPAALPLHRLKPLLSHPDVDLLLQLQHAELGAAGADAAAFLSDYRRTTPPEVLNPPPLLTGDDLTALGYAPGPGFRRTLERVRAAQLDGAAHSPEQARRIAAQELGPPPAPGSPDA